jgi:transposase InsO family protein
MPWKVQSPMSVREEFVSLASLEDANVSLLCRRFGISRKTGYKWLSLRRADPAASLADRSRRPVHWPTRTDDAMEQQVIALRQQHPAWGARKLKRRLEDQSVPQVPARSTINGILRRHGLIDAAQSPKHTALRRFERAAPNELWQMDFKGDFATAGGRCHPLTVLDDHSRYNLVLKACDNQRTETVQAALTDAMRLYGMPACLLSDNGPPFGGFRQAGYYTALGVWLIRHGVSVAHGRPRHPQTQGKEERFHRTLNVEVIAMRVFTGVGHCQEAFDDWRPVYNHQRPHEALDLQVPAKRYTPSQRSFPAKEPAVEYDLNDDVRKVCGGGRVSFQGVACMIGTAFAGQRVAVRPTAVDGKMEVFYCHQRVAKIDLSGESNVR